MSEDTRDPRLPPRGERTGHRMPHRRNVLERRVVQHPGGNFLEYTLSTNRKSTLFAIEECWYDPAEEHKGHGGMARWMVTYVTTSSRKRFDAWLAAVRAMPSVDPASIEARRPESLKNANWDA